MWRKLLHSGFQIGHSLGRVETCFGPCTQGAAIRYQNTSRIQILRASYFDTRGVRDVRTRDALAGVVAPVRGNQGHGN